MIIVNIYINLFSLFWRKLYQFVAVNIENDKINSLVNLLKKH